MTKTTKTPTARVVIRSSKKKPAAKKSASIVFFAVREDSRIMTFFQETTRFKKAMQGYDKVVLLKSEQLPKNFDLSQADERLADVKDTATKENLVKYIKDLCKDGYYMDIYLWSHGAARRRGKAAYFQTMPKASLSTTWLKQQLAPKKTGFRAMPIRMVYSTSCWASHFNSTWLSLGAKAAVGTRYVNFYPTQYGKFIAGWNKGHSLSKSVRESNTVISRTLVQTFLAKMHAPATRRSWGKCPFAKSVLMKHGCAKAYFTHVHNMADSEYNSSKTGKWNMNYSSQYIVSGSSRITKRSKPKW